MEQVPINNLENEPSSNQVADVCNDDESQVRKSSRTKKLTEKARQNKVEELKALFEAGHVDLVNELGETERLLSISPADTQELQFRRADLSGRLNSLQGFAESLRAIQADSSIEKSLEEVTRSTFETISKIVRACSEVDEAASLQSPSMKSVTSSSALTTSKRIIAAAEAAALQARLEAQRMENDQLEELERLELEEAARKLQAERKIAAMRRRLEEEKLAAQLRAEEAKLKAYDKVSVTSMSGSSSRTKSRRGESVSSSVVRQLRPVERPTAKSRLDPEAESFQPARFDNVSLADALSNAMALSRLPIPEPPVFMGDPLQYPDWAASFSALIESRNIPPAERIHYLRRYLGGSAKDAVSGYFLLRSGDSYQQARDVLERRFGNPFVISEAFRSKLDSWPRVQSRDGKALRNLADFLQQCMAASSEISDLRILNDMREIKKISDKLPEWLTHRWNRQVVKEKREFGQYPNFSRFTSFIAEEAEILTDPIISSQSARTSRANSLPSAYQRPSTRTVLATANSNSQSNTGCLFCKRQNHETSSCRDFSKKPMKERREFVKRESLCFGCLGHGHISSCCPKRSVCKNCNKKHPTSLHDSSMRPPNAHQASANQPQHTYPPVEQGSSCRTSVRSNTALTSMIIPVYVSTRDDPSNEILVYALLDSMSDTTFIVKSVAEDLDTHHQDAVLRLTTLTSENSTIQCHKYSNLLVRGLKTEARIELPTTFSRDYIPLDESHIPTPEVAQQWQHLHHLSDVIAPKQNCPVGLLIGYNCSRALAPRNCVLGNNEEPFAVETDLGWSIIGGTKQLDEAFDSVGQTHRIVARFIPSDADPSEPHDVTYVSKVGLKEITASDLLRVIESDFVDKDSTLMSQDDFKFISIVKEGINQRNDGYYEMPLPFKNGEPKLRNNRKAALHRTTSLKKRLESHPQYKEHYISFMRGIIARGEAERVTPEDPDNEHAWYIPHHGVYHPKKPHKVRVVFDCSARYHDTSLNEHLLQGPDLVNPLVGVLTRFRKESIAFTCDVEKMYHQFRVRKDHQRYLRFLWWPDDNLSVPPVDYEMKVHLFGATSSPGCANFALKQIAEDYRYMGGEAANFLKKGFYVDDGLACTASAEEAVSLIQNTIAICKQGNLRLHKFISNNPEVLKSIPETERSEQSKTCLGPENSCVEHTLGLQWCIESDCFSYRIILKDSPLTKRGVLATIASVYDPLGLISPLVLAGRQILQEMCKDHLDWDQSLPEELRPKWEKWREELLKLELVKIPRCFHPADFGTATTTELHHFSDASLSGYGQCSYVRLRDSKGDIHCSLVMAKARVTPLKPTTIPRLELQAATMSSKVSKTLNTELDYPKMTHYFWTDSKVVLGYIKNASRRFHMYVANRVQSILQASHPDQWQYVNTTENPADHTSRGLTADELTTSNWFTGPKFLWQAEIRPQIIKTDISSDDVEVKPAVVCSVQRINTTFEDRIKRFSTYRKLITAFSMLIRRVQGKGADLSDLEARVVAERNLIKIAQKEAFSDQKLRELTKLDPFVDDQGVLRVGGRLRKASLLYGVKHPVILPKDSHLSLLIAAHYHEKTAHQGRNLTINALRTAGLWIVGCRQIVSSLVRKCVQCIRLRGQPLGQRMADLPKERVEPSPPFTHCGLDCFGPFVIKEGRKEIKRYGLIVTCLAMRAVHIELLDDMSTDSFLNGLRCVIALRGTIRTIRCDQGTNFVGAKHELKRALKELDGDRIAQKMLDFGCEFKMNPPSSSHMGGVWERQIRTIRSVLSGILDNSGSTLNVSSLRTFLYEAMAIVNSRPLTVENLHGQGHVPLSPNQLLTFKSGIVMPPPGSFEREDLYLKKRWRRVQYLVNLFWNRWRKEYLHTLQARSTWTKRQKNISSGDVVILLEEGLVRTQWQLARVIEAVPGDDGLVRKAKLLMSTPKLDKYGKPLQCRSVIERPAHKLIVLVPSAKQ